MRILDKNTDFYDYVQNIYRDESFTFDRTDSFELTKEELYKRLGNYRHNSVGDHRYILLQVCNTFWLFLAEVSQVSDDSWHKILEYNIELLSTWKCYNADRVLMRLDVINFPWTVLRSFYTYRGFRPETDEIHKKFQRLKTAIDTNDFEVVTSINSHTTYRRIRGELVGNEKHIPLLKASGLAQFIDPIEIYLAFEEYFSLEKTAVERTESVGLTNKEKVENHGFDIKTSFRGKS